MKSLKIARMNIEEMIKPTMIFYTIIISIIIIVTILRKSLTTHIGVPEVDMITTIFLFVCGLNSFKSDFYFAKANNVSRNNFIVGIIFSVFPIVFTTSILDLIINRITNLFTAMPSSYDFFFDFSSGMNWIQSNTLEVLFYTFFIHFLVGVALYLAGVVIRMIYYRSNKAMKIILSVMPIAIIVGYSKLWHINGVAAQKLEHFLFSSLGLEPSNKYCTIVTFMVISIVLSIVSLLLIRKVTIKENN